MLNFISPWMTQYTREKHDGKRNPSINMTNRKPSAGRKCPYIAPEKRSEARKARVIAGLAAHVEHHPKDSIRSAMLARLTA